MRIAFIASNRNSANGGSEELWVKAALYALKKGHQVYCVIYKHIEPHYLHKELSQRGATLLYRDLRGKHHSLITRLILKMKSVLLTKLKGVDYEFKWIYKANIDCVCMSQGSAYDHTYQLCYDLLFKKLTCPYYLILHSFNKGMELRESRRVLSRRIMARANKVFFVAKAQKKEVERQLGNLIENGVLVQNPLNLLSMDILDFPKKPSLHMVCVGNLLFKWKGQDLLLEALSSRKWRNRNWQLRIFGEGSDRHLIVDLLDKYKLADKVSLMGLNRDVHSIYSQSQILIMPSRVEAAPLTVREAMVCGRPVLTTDVGDMKDYFVDSESGFLALEASVDAIAGALERMWEQKANLESMGRRAHQKALQEIDKEPEQTFLDLLMSE